MTSDKATIFVIGVSGTGKSTIASALADQLDGNFLDADDYHSSQNKTSMASGAPLTDDMREGWLKAVCAATNEQVGTTVVACSALKKSYRDMIRSKLAGVTFIFLEVNQEVLANRIASRTEHFMPVSLLQSQLQTLQVPTPDERDLITLDGTLPIVDILEKIVLHLNK